MTEGAEGWWLSSRSWGRLQICAWQLLGAAPPGAQSRGGATEAAAVSRCFLACDWCDVDGEGVACRVLCARCYS
jgi:hypothetical protein